MVRRVFLHIGAPKTGTTALQTRLQGNAASLLERGVLVPMGEQGSGKRPAGLVLRAALELTGVTLGQRPEALVGEWDRLVEQVTATPYETTIISHEAFVRCDAATAATAVRDLGAGAEAHVVYTARDLGRQLVSGWLEGLKNGGDDDLATHLARARSGDLPLRHAFDIPQVLGRWLDHVPAERIHLLTVPPPGGDRDLLCLRSIARGGAVFARGGTLAERRDELPDGRSGASICSVICCCCIIICCCIIACCL